MKMCEWFSFLSDGKGKFFYFSDEQRKSFLKSNPNKLNMDSHASLAEYYFGNSKAEDKSNKYEYNPFTETFKIDQINTTNDSQEAEKWVKELFKREFLYIKNAKKEIERIKNIKWFKPIKTINKKQLQVKANLIAKAFNLDFKVSLEINKLETSAAESAAWSAAESAARSAARSAAESAAWIAARSAAWSAAESAAWIAAESAARSAAFEISADVNTKYKTNPFKLLVDLLEKGFYVCGIVDKKLILYYVPEKVKR